MDSPCGCPLSAKPIQGRSNCKLLIIGFYLRYAPESKDIYFPHFGIFFLFEKENACKRKANSGLRPETPSTPRRSTKLTTLNQLLGTFARKLASLKQYGLVRLASQAVPSLLSVGLLSTAARLLETCLSRLAGSPALTLQKLKKRGFLLPV